MSMKNSNDTIRNRTRDLQACIAVPQPTASLRAHCKLCIRYKNYTIIWTVTYTTYCNYLSYVRPANRHMVPGVTLCHKKDADPWVSPFNYIQIHTMQISQTFIFYSSVSNEYARVCVLCCVRACAWCNFRHCSCWKIPSTIINSEWWTLPTSSRYPQRVSIACLPLRES